MKNSVAIAIFSFLIQETKLIINAIFIERKKILEKSKKFTVTSKYLINYLLKKHNEY